MSGQQMEVRLFDKGAAQYADTDGTPYLTDKFRDAVVDGDSEVYPMRYDAYQDEMQFKKDGKILLLDKTIDHEILFLDDSTRFMSITLDGGARGFAEVLWSKEEQKAALLKHYQIGYSPETMGNGYSGSKPARFGEPRSGLFFRTTKDYTLIKVPNGRKKIFQEIFGKDLRKEAKSYDLDPVKEGDLIKLLDIFYEYES
ncbi:MAG: hypothetical protein AAF740_09330 [Bacteroidota bacterium]